MVVLIFVPEADCADPLKTSVPPRAREVLVVGVRVMCPANSAVPPFLLPPHPAKVMKERIVTAKNRPRKRNLPMHPSSHLATADVGTSRRRDC